MTRKSSARVARDMAAKQAEDQNKMEKKIANDLKGNTCWDDLNNMYSSMIQLLGQHTHLYQFAADKDIIAAVDDKTTLANNIRILANDLKVLNTELTAIHESHKDKVGGSTDPDEVIGTIQIFEQYNLFMERHEAVIMPIAYHIIEQFDKAEKKLVAVREQLNAESKAAADLLDPTVISDVEVITTTTKEETVGLEIAGIVHESVTKPDFAKLADSFNALHGTNVSVDQTKE